jgi:hypothetical protein
MNTCGSVAVRVNVCFVTVPQKWRIIISSNVQKEFGNESLSCAQLFRCHKDFVNGRETVEDERRFVRTKTNFDSVRTFLRQDRRLTIRMMADELNINEYTVHQIVIQDLNVRKLRAKMVQKI